MAKETLDRIKKAELEAQQIVSDARKKAQQIVEDARLELNEYSQSRLSKARTEAAAELERIQSGSQSVFTAAKDRAQANIAQLNKKIRSREDAAVKMVIEHII